MNCISFFTFFVIVSISLCYAITCEQAKSILNIEYEGDCCDLQQINCNEENEILSIESLLDEDYIENEKTLYRRKGGGGRSSGGRSSKGSKSSKSKVKKIKKKSKSNGIFDDDSECDDENNDGVCDGALTIQSKTFIWVLAIVLLLNML